ncbi:MAG: hypothetical protein ACRD3I_01020, partial [Terriglobales bacterium]
RQKHASGNWARRSLHSRMARGHPPILARTRGASEFELWHNAVRTRNDFAPSLLLRIKGEGSGARLVCRLDFSPAAATFAKWMRPAAVVVGVYWMLHAGWVLIHSGLSVLSPLGILLGATVIVLAWVGPRLAYDQASGDAQKLLGFVRHALAARESESGGG